jgi:diadenosine tetraphosphate (Ap4A) HIT family hydrolase
MMSFQLHPRLQQDCIYLGSFELSQLLLMNDSHYPWFILVPQRADLSEIYQLNETDRQLLQTESCLLAQTLASLYQADKMNIAAIGNLVPQLHLHHVVRYQTDAAWPAPVWGKFTAIPYTAAQIAQHQQLVQDALSAFLHHSIKSTSCNP